MAELVEDEGPVEITIPEARLDDAGRRKLIQFYEKKPVLWDTSLKLPKKDAKDQKLAAIKELEEHFGFLPPSNPTSRPNNSFPISSFFIFQIVH